MNKEYKIEIHFTNIYTRKYDEQTKKIQVNNNKNN